MQRKALVLIIAVAIIGTIGVYVRQQDNSKNTVVAMPSADTSAQKVESATNDQTQSQSSATDKTSTTSQSSSTELKDGTYTGRNEETVYGPVQVAIVVDGGKITDVKFLRMPNDRGHTQEVTAFSEPQLEKQTLANQNGHVDFVSGATQTSEGYQQSLQSALDQAA